MTGTHRPTRPGSIVLTGHEQCSEVGAKVKWDDQAQVPYYSYKSGGVTRKVYFESADSLKVKLGLVNRYDIGGIAIWRLGQEDDASWRAIRAALMN